MFQSVPHQNSTINTNVVLSKNSTTCILFLYGGSLTIRKERFLNWQKDLQETGVSSVAFDYIGIHETEIKQRSLALRIEEAISVINWIQNKLPSAKIILYGVSMGGYTALGANARLPYIIDKLILHAPAAYAAKAHEVPFSYFTKIIREPGNWQDSLAFTWLGQSENPVLFLYPELDEVIPKEITQQYLDIGYQKTRFTDCCIKNATHKCWSNSKKDEVIRNIFYKQMLEFIN